MQDLLKNKWINGTNLEVLSTTPLATPDVLSLTRGSVSTIQTQITATLTAFHKAHRAGFRLQDVSNAPLARRRKRMREECGSSGSTDSSRSSTPVPPSVNFPSPLAVGKTASPTLGVVSAGPGTSGFQPCSSVTQPVSYGSELLPPLSVIVTSVSDSTVWDSVLRSDSTLSCGFSLRNSPASHSSPLRHFSAAESSSSHRATPSHSPASKPPTDGSSSSHGSRSPLSRAASFTSMGFSPAASAANGSENSCHDSDAAAAAQIPSSSVISSSSHSDGSVAVNFCSDDVSRKRKRRMDDSDSKTEHDSSSTDDDDDGCVIVVSKGITSSSDACKRTRRQL